MCFHSKYLTEELKRIFIEDTDSEIEDFEGFTESELNMNSDPEVTVVLPTRRGVTSNVPRPALNYPFILTCYLIREKMVLFILFIYFF